MQAPRFGAFRPGGSPLHRVSPGPKLLGLVFFAVLVVVLPWPFVLDAGGADAAGTAGGAAGAGAAARTGAGASVPGALSACVALACGAALCLCAGMRVRDLLRIVRGLLLIAVPLFAFQWWQHGPLHAAHIVGDLFAMVFAASAVSASTAPGDLLDALVRWLGPLRRMRVHPERVGLALALAIAAIPTVFGLAQETDAAARARGLQWSVRARLVPFVLRTVAHAQVLGEALAARGVDD